MSGRSKRAKHQEPDVATNSKRTTGSVSNSNLERKRQRSVSPFNISRSEEKEELAHLNDRLASYIDYVRKLEMDKETLTRKVKSYTEERLSKHDDARNTYETEISSLRQLVDEIAKQKTAAEVDAKKAREDAAAARSKLTKRDVEMRNYQRRIEALEKDLASYKQSHDAYKVLVPEYDMLDKRCEVLRRDLNAETILRTDLENKVAGLREELDFVNRLLEEERTKLIQRTLAVETEIETRKTADFESKLYEQLQSYREQTAAELLDYRNEMETAFETKLTQLRTANNDASRESGKLREELIIVRKHADDMEHELAKKVAEVQLLNRRVDELDRLLHLERDEYEKRLLAQREEVERLQRELEIRFSEFTDLMNTKVALDQEILMYRKMLEGEETRLHISTPARETPFLRAQPRANVGVDYDASEKDDGDINSTSTSSFGGGLARVTYRVSTHASGSVEFTADQDEHAKYVKLINSSSEDTSLGNWVIKQLVDENEITYKFHRSLVLRPGETCQIWNSDSEMTHAPPKDLVMRNQNFKQGDNIKFILLNNDGDEQADCQIIRERIRCVGPRLHSQPSDEKCSLM